MRPPVRYFRADGRLEVVQIGLERKAFVDVYHFLMRSTWPRLIFLFFGAYVILNLLFGALYLLDGGVENAAAGRFVDYFFFSVHTMMTIGYGSMAPRSMTANFLVMVEAFVGLLCAATFTGIVFNKFSLPIARVLFSKVAVITRRDGLESLLFRMANERVAQVVEAELHVVLTRNERTVEGEQVRRFHSLNLARDRSAIFALSWTAVHVIDEKSPLFGATAESLRESASEILVSLVGIDETSSQTVHARHVYSPAAIIFGARFVDIFGRYSDGRRFVDYTKLHDFVSAPGPGEGPETSG